MVRLIVLTLVACVSAAACAGGADRPGNSPDDDVPIVLGSPTVPGAPEFHPATIMIDGADEGPILLRGEVADTEETRGFGLMGRTEIPDDYGMAFIMFEETDCCFYMKNTLIPLSVAFFDADGRIVDFADMTPCEKDPCKLYGSDEPYTGALEVHRGAFDEWGVSEGDRIRIIQ